MEKTVENVENFLKFFRSFGTPSAFFQSASGAVSKCLRLNLKNQISINSNLMARGLSPARPRFARSSTACQRWGPTHSHPQRRKKELWITCGFFCRFIFPPAPFFKKGGVYFLPFPPAPFPLFLTERGEGVGSLRSSEENLALFHKAKVFHFTLCTSCIIL